MSLYGVLELRKKMTCGRTFCGFGRIQKSLEFRKKFGKLSPHRFFTAKCFISSQPQKRSRESMELPFSSLFWLPCYLDKNQVSGTIKRIISWMKRDQNFPWRKFFLMILQKLYNSRKMLQYLPTAKVFSRKNFYSPICKSFFLQKRGFFRKEQCHDKNIATVFIYFLLLLTNQK